MKRLYKPWLTWRTAGMISLGRMVLLASITLGLLALGGCSRVTSRATVAWQWHQSDTELNNAQFSPDGNEIALVNKYGVTTWM